MDSPESFFQNELLETAVNKSEMELLYNKSWSHNNYSPHQNRHFSDVDAVEEVVTCKLNAIAVKIIRPIKVQLDSQ